MEEQKATQGLVVAAMSYVPGFDTYSFKTLLDAPFYKPFTVYGGQVNVDNRRNSRGLIGPSEQK
mgnify:FL=1